MNKLIETTVARVADAELDTIHKVRDLVTTSEQRALYAAFDESLQAIKSLEMLPATLNEMTSALRTELQTAADGLRNGPEPEQEHEPEPEPKPELESRQPSPGAEFDPALTEMFRDGITDMWRSGKPRDEAQQTLLRFRSGHYFLGLLDEIYSAKSGQRKKGILSRRR